MSGFRSISFGKFDILTLNNTSTHTSLDLKIKLFYLPKLEFKKGKAATLNENSHTESKLNKIFGMAGVRQRRLARKDL